MMTWAPAALAEEATVATPNARFVKLGHSFASVNGPQGAGLSFSPAQQGRVYAEFGFHTQTASSQDDTSGASFKSTTTMLSWVLGGGYKLSPAVELEAILPMSFFDFSQTVTAGPLAGGGGDSTLVVGNLHLGLNWLKVAGMFRLKLGAGLEWGPWSSSHSAVGNLALGAGSALRSNHDIGLWQAERFSVVTPSHIEFGDDFVVTADFALGLHVSTGGADPEISLQLDPGIGYYASRDALVGVRLPMVALPTSDNPDKGQLAVEPYARVAFGSGFLNLRFTVNLDEPLGFAFDDGKIWALHIGGGGSF